MGAPAWGAGQLAQPRPRPTPGVAGAGSRPSPLHLHEVILQVESNISLMIRLGSGTKEEET